MSIEGSDQSAPSAVVGVLHDNGQFLLIQRAQGVPAPGWWAPPSGRIEPGETAPAAVTREMQEELGISVHPVRQVWACPSDDGRFTLQWWLCTTESREFNPDPREVAAVRWCTVDEIRDLSPTFGGDVTFFVDIWPSIAPD